MINIKPADIPEYAKQLNRMGLKEALARGREKLEGLEAAKYAPIKDWDEERLAGFVQAVVQSPMFQIWNQGTQMQMILFCEQGDLEGLKEFLQEVGDRELLGDLYPPRTFTDEEDATLKTSAEKTIKGLAAKLEKLDKVLPRAAELPTIEEAAEKLKSLISGVHDKYKDLPVDKLEQRITEVIVDIASAEGADLDKANPEEVKAWAEDQLADLLETYKLFREFVATFDANKDDYADLLYRYMKLGEADPVKVAEAADKMGAPEEKKPAFQMVKKAIMEKLLGFRAVKQALVMAIDAALEPGDPIANVKQAFGREEDLKTLLKLFNDDGGMERVLEVVGKLQALGLPVSPQMIAQAAAAGQR